MTANSKTSRWSWLPAMMPKVAEMLAERRAEHGAAWVAKCWARGVVDGEPGWFYAAEGAIAVGTPISAEVVTTYHQVRGRVPGSVLLDMKLPEGVAA